MIGLSIALTANAQLQHVLKGHVVDAETGKPVEFASVLLSESGLWAISKEKGDFQLQHVPEGQNTLVVQCLGYEKRTLTITVKRDIDNLTLKLKQSNLKLDEVTVMAKRKTDEATTSYTIDRQALDNQQILNVSDVTVLLPGGKTVNPTLMSDNRIALRSDIQEKGNASFGTAIEVDGMRLDNNAANGETMGASTRTLSASNIESVEIVTGIPSVEYGDLSNGVVKVNTRKGKSPFIVEGKLNQHTRQIAVNKGFALGSHAGVLNASIEHARSFADAASPHTAYQRNIMSLNYANVLMQETTPLTLQIGLTGNIGGYDSKTDPDEELDNYSKARDNAFRANFDLHWLLNKTWITNVQLSGSLSYSDRRSENYSHTSSASTQPYIHTLQEGYFMAQDYDAQAGIVPPVVLGPTGYWYVRGYNDSKPLSWALKAKADWMHRFGKTANRLVVGSQYTGSKNNGQGTYYDDMSVAPSWREYRYDQLPAMNNLAFYVEDKVIVPTTRQSTLELTAGLRDDITLISGSDYGTVSSLSPRVNGRYIFWRGQQRQWVSDLLLHAGWGKSVKLPSFQVLYPSPAYSDILSFASTSTSENKSYYAYHTYPSKAQYNPNLRWQHTNQADLGIEATILGTHVSLSAFYHKTCRSYMSTKTYTPFTYHYTGQTAVQQSGIPVENRTFTIDPATGTVTTHDRTGAMPDKELAYTDKRTYVVNQHYINASPVSRYGLEWIVDFAQIKPLHTSIRLDGNYYHYKGTDDVFFADVPLGISNIMSDGQPYQYIGYYRGSNVTGAGSSAHAAISNGGLSKQVNLNTTFTTHIPKIRMIVSLRIEASLYNYHRSLSELDGTTRGYVLDDNNGYTGEPYDGKSLDKLVVVYPEYYTTWEQPTELIPFAEKFLWAKDNDPVLYSDLSQLVVRSNYAYTMNPNKLSAYYSANLSVTKEIGDHISVSFYANNFLNNMKTIHSSQTDLESSLFGSSYIPSYYYGLSLRVKI